MGGVVAFIDAEHALDPGYAARIGVDIDEVLISQPDTGEQALEICDMLVRSGAIDVVVVDSVAALTPRAEIEGEIGDSTVGLQARLMSQALRKLAGSLSKSNTTCIFINQLREKIGVMFGNPRDHAGTVERCVSRHVRMDIRRVDSIKNKDEVIGNRVRVKVVKNKVAPPFRQGRVRHHVRPGHLEGGLGAGHGGGLRRRQQVRRLVHLRERAPRPGDARRPRSSSPPTPRSWRRSTTRCALPAGSSWETSASARSSTSRRARLRRTRSREVGLASLVRRASRPRLPGRRDGHGPTRATLSVSTPTHGDERIPLPVAVGRRLDALAQESFEPSCRAELLHRVGELSRQVRARPHGGPGRTSRLLLRRACRAPLARRVPARRRRRDRVPCAGGRHRRRRALRRGVRPLEGALRMGEGQGGARARPARRRRERHPRLARGVLLCRRRARACLALASRRGSREKTTTRSSSAFLARAGFPPRRRSRSPARCWPRRESRPGEPCGNRGRAHLSPAACLTKLALRD